MSLASDFSTPSQTPAAQGRFWAFLDASLLCGVLITSSDMLVQVRFLQSPLWMYCYALALFRIALMWPYFLPVLMRNRVVMIYPAICVASTLWSVSKSYTLVASLQLTMTMLIAMYLGWRYSMNVLIKTTAVVLSIGVALSLLHLATGIFPWPVHTRVGGLAGLFSSKNMLGLRALFTVIAILAILMMHRNEVGSLFRQLAFFALLGNLLALALSLSMTSVLLLPVMVGLLFALCWHRVPPALVMVAMVLTLLGLSIGPIVLAIAGVNPIEAVLGAVGKSTTLTGRVYIWAVAMDVYNANPFLGVGYRAFWQAPQFLNERLATIAAGASTSRSFHQFILEILVSVGWSGVVAILALCWAAISRMWQVYLRTGSVAMAAGLSLMFGIIISSLTGTTLYRAHEIMIVLTVAFAVSAGEDLRVFRKRASNKKGFS